MKIKKGDYYRSADRQVWLATSDHSDDLRLVRVIVRDAKPRRTIKPSEALAWLMAQKEWTVRGGWRELTCQWAVKVDGQPWLTGPTLTKAIIALRKAMGVR